MRKTNTDLNIEILGINIQSDAVYNPSFTTSRTLPWLQDTAEQNVWSSWKAVWRDVRILDSQNRQVTSYNLTDHDLSNPLNYLALKQLLLTAAQLVDSEQNGLPDDWELQYFGHLPMAPDADADGDGASNLLEYAFGTDPTNRSDVKALHFAPAALPPANSVSFSFRRRAGSILNYVVEASSDLKQWTTITPDLLSVSPPRNLFDGTGTSEVVCASTAAGRIEPLRFLRVRATAR